MALVDLDISIEPIRLPRRVLGFLEEAAGRIDEFEARRRNDPIPGFVPSDFPLVYQLLRAVRQVHLPTGDRFCEWGSGFGVVAALADMIGFEAYGIEIDGDLYREACRLAEDFHCEPQFVQGSFLPDDAGELADTLGDFHWLETSGANGYAELDLSPDDFDVIFAYPWPGEESVITEVFDRYAASGALLLTYHGIEQVRVRRKACTRSRI